MLLVTFACGDLSNYSIPIPCAFPVPMLTKKGFILSCVENHVHVQITNGLEENQKVQGTFFPFTIFLKANFGLFSF